MPRPIRILALTDNFVPERNAPALRMHEHCRRWVERGAQVTVITGVPNFPAGTVYPPYKNHLYQREMIDGIEVIRVWTFIAANTGVVRRSLDFLSFAVTAFFAGLRQKPDVIVATSPQLLTGVTGALLARWKRCPWIFEVRDLWPDSITAVGAAKGGLLIDTLRWIERHLYKSATLIITVSGGLKDAIATKGVSPEKIRVVHNGAGMRRFHAAPVDPELQTRLGLEGKFIVGYVGTHGLAQGLETLIYGAELLREETDIHVLLVGEGARRAALIELSQSRGLTNVTLVGAVPAAQVPAYLAICGAIAVPLRKSDISPGAIPSKIFDAAAMGKPIILGVTGISTELVNKYNAGVAIEPESPDAFAAAVRALKADSNRCRVLSAGARNIARDYDRDALADLMFDEIASLLKSQLHS